MDIRPLKSTMWTLCLFSMYCTDMYPLSRYCVDMCPLSRYCVDICPHSSYCPDIFCWFLAVFSTLAYKPPLEEDKSGLIGGVSSHQGSMY